MNDQRMQGLRSRFTDELIWFLVSLACDHSGEARQALQDLKEIGQEFGLGEEWTIAVEDVLADLHHNELHRKAGSILRLHSLAQTVLHPPRSDSD